ncbi:hypothetical protein DFJ67_7895 [Asanoa ferruginea]|uniref:ESAT-6 protein secretion system EspG family protein n=1 Tax=Asanoa ferruginea TaxID=53367 RepID=A0A3D9ZXB7_9ACTN|nr:hypothetical protein [Asanoa ferruginea]REG01806.1 hypothetical protein DFJ67_7895 [Asanoa ferruginea]GIF49160.1 hypothetical protein Afe04nite_36990 [Asanoa ferruginea]
MSKAAEVPGNLVSSVVDLVDTGPVLLGAYTSAELTAVDAVVDFLEARPSDDVLAEAVRSLAARELLVASDGDEQLQVRGDLGIAVAFQQRARQVLDARVTGTEPGEPWRMLILPQPELITLLIRIDALGVHDLGLFPADDALDQLVEWLPRGDYEKGGDAAEVLAASSRSALVTVTDYTSEGSAETAGESEDLVLARRGGDLYAFGRDEADRSHLVPRRLEDNKVDDTIKAMLA